MLWASVPPITSETMAHDYVYKAMQPDVPPRLKLDYLARLEEWIAAQCTVAEEARQAAVPKLPPPGSGNWACAGDRVECGRTGDCQRFIRQLGPHCSDLPPEPSARLLFPDAE